MKIFNDQIEFEWDTGNKDKSLKKHQVTNQECEEVFFGQDKKILKDVLHSEFEERYLLIGKTTTGRLLFIVYTIRKKKIRIISARDINKKELKLIQ